MALGTVIIIAYILTWVNGTPIYYTDKHFVYNIGVNLILVIGILMFIKDFKKVILKRKQNKNNQMSEDTKNDKKKSLNGQNKYNFQYTAVYIVLSLSIFINILLLFKTLSINNNLKEVQQQFDKYKENNIQTCKYHTQLTENGPVDICD